MEMAMSEKELLSWRVIVAAGALVDVKDDPESLRQAIGLLSVAVRELDEYKSAETIKED